MAAGMAAGGTLGGVAQSRSAPAIHGAFFDEVRADVPAKASAIVLLAAPEHVDAMVAAIGDNRHGRLVRRSLSEEESRALALELSEQALP
jgi:uncharacterized membrane protein